MSSDVTEITFCRDMGHSGAVQSQRNLILRNGFILPEMPPSVRNNLRYDGIASKEILREIV